MSTTKLLLSILLAMAIVGMLPRPATAQTPDPVAVVKASLDAVNRGDVEAALALFADDATFRRPPDSWTGTEQLRAMLQADVAIHSHIEASNFQLAGDQVTYTFKGSNDRFRSLGIDSIEGTTTVTVQGGKVTLVTTLPSPESRARIQAALAAARTAPQAMPNTGALDAPFATLLLALGGLAVLAGAGMRARRRM